MTKLTKEVRNRASKNVFAVMLMQIRGSKARSEGAYIWYVTELSNAADDGGAPLDGKKG